MLDESKEYNKGKCCFECENHTEDDDGDREFCKATMFEIELDYVAGGYNCKMKECKEINTDGKCTIYKKCTFGEGQNE